MRVGDEQPRQEIRVLGGHARAALAAAILRPVKRQRHALDIALMGDGDDHVLALDEVLVLHVGAGVRNLGATRRAELVAHGSQFVLDDLLDARAGRKNIKEIGYFRADLVQFVGDLVTPQRGQALQAQVEDGARLFLGKIVGAVLVDAVARIVDQPDQRLDVGRRPAPRHQLVARRLRVRRAADQLDHLVDVGDGDGKADQHMSAVARLAQQELGPAAHHLLAEGDEGLQHVDECHHFRLAAVQRHDVGAEGGLQRREAVELVEDDLGVGVALQLDHDAVALPVALVADVGDALDALVAHQFGHLLDHRRLVHLIGNLGDDDGLAVAAALLHMHLAAHDDGAAAGRIGGIDAGAA